MSTVESIELNVMDQAIHCDGCESRIQRALNRLPGVSKVEADQKTQKIRLTLDQDKTLVNQIIEKLAFLGYPVAPSG